MYKLFGESDIDNVRKLTLLCRWYLGYIILLKNPYNVIKILFKIDIQVYFSY